MSMDMFASHYHRSRPMSDRKDGGPVISSKERLISAVVEINH